MNCDNCDNCELHNQVGLEAHCRECKATGAAADSPDALLVQWEKACRDLMEDLADAGNTTSRQMVRQHMLDIYNRTIDMMASKAEPSEEHRRDEMIDKHDIANEFKRGIAARIECRTADGSADGSGKTRAFSYGWNWAHLNLSKLIHDELNKYLEFTSEEHRSDD